MTGVGVKPSCCWTIVWTPLRGEHLERRLLGWSGQRVRVLAHVERTVDAVLPAILADGLGDRRDVRRGETAIERRSPVAAGAERDALTAVAQVGDPLEEFTLERGDVDQRSRGGRLARERVRHAASLLRAFSSQLSALS